MFLLLFLCWCWDQLLVLLSETCDTSPSVQQKRRVLQPLTTPAEAVNCGCKSTYEVVAGLITAVVERKILLCFYYHRQVPRGDHNQQRIYPTNKQCLCSLSLMCSWKVSTLCQNLIPPKTEAASSSHWMTNYLYTMTTMYEVYSETTATMFLIMTDIQ